MPILKTKYSVFHWKVHRDYGYVVLDSLTMALRDENDTIKSKYIPIFIIKISIVYNNKYKKRIAKVKQHSKT